MYRKYTELEASHASQKQVVRDFKPMYHVAAATGILCGA